MKLLKSLSFGLIAAATVGSASAATIINVAGSTAFRTGTSIAIIDTLSGTTAAGGPGSTPVFAAYSDTSVAGASQQIFANGHIDGTAPVATIIVAATWTGSLAGVVDLVAQSSTTAFIDESNPTVQAAVSAGTVNLSTYLGGTNLNSKTLVHSTNQPVELALSDSNKTTIQKEVATANFSGNVGTFSSPASLASAVGGASVVDAGTTGFAKDAGVVAVVPFQWCMEKITAPGYTAPTNISQQTARQLIQAGFVKQAQFTGGNAATDLSNFFYLTGRNEDSGTRIGAFAESQFGVVFAPNQYSVGNGTSTLAGSALFPANSALNTEPAISWATAGHSGYASGGNVGNALKIANDGSPVSFASGKPASNTGSSYFIGYLGVTDAAGAISGGATPLSYNGVPYSASAVQNGSYSFWTYEHAYRLSSLSGTQLSVVNAIADNLYFTDADAIYNTSTGLSHAEDVNTGVYTAGSAGLFVDGFLNVSRSTTEGGPVSHN